MTMYDPEFEKQFESRKAQYEAAVTNHVCHHCIDFGEDNMCHGHDGEPQCVVIKNLKEIVYIAKSVNSDQIDPYIKVLRDRVCAHCDNSHGEGSSCERRNELECCLDRYFPLILQAIEEAEKNPNS